MNREGYTSVERWLERLSDSTRKINLWHLKNFMKWLRVNGAELRDYTPDQLVNYQKNAEKNKEYNILDLLQSYIGSFNARQSYKLRVYSCIRSFFNHNRAELPRDSGFTIRGDKEKVRGDLTIKEIREVVLSSKPAYRAIILSMLQAGMGLEEIVYWNTHGWERLCEALKGEPDVIKVDLPGRKKSKNVRPYYSYVGPDAIKALREWVSVRPPNSSAIFTDQYGQPISKVAIKYYWKRHMIGLGLVKPLRNMNSGNRYGKNLHELRDTFRTLWEKSGARGTAAEYFMGHQVDALEYNKAFQDEAYGRAEYRKAVSYLNIMSSPKPYGQVEEDQFLELKAEVQKLRLEESPRIRDLEDRLEEEKKLREEFQSKFQKYLNEMSDEETDKLKELEENARWPVPKLIITGYKWS